MRRPLIFGIPFAGLLVLSFLTVLFQFLAQGDLKRSLIGMGVSGVIFVGLRVFQHFSKVGWDQSILFLIERVASSSKGKLGAFEAIPTEIEVFPPDTLDELDLLSSKSLLEESLKHSSQNENLILKCEVAEAGATLSEIRVKALSERTRKKSDLAAVAQLLTGIESARKLNSHFEDTGQVDSDISFEEASHVLRGLSRGDECTVLNVSSNLWVEFIKNHNQYKKWSWV